MRLLPIPALLLLLSMTPHALAVCTAGDVKAGCGGACVTTCDAVACIITGTAAVTPPSPGATCTFDFGALDVVLTSGGFVGGANVFEISARGLTVAGGGRLTATQPGRVSLTLGDGGFSVASGATPLLVGGGLTVQSAGNVLISGAPIRATGAIGGTVAITTTGPPATGTIDLGNTVDVSGTAQASGPGNGGRIVIHATGDVLLGAPPQPSAPLLAADGALGAEAGDGGIIEIVAGGRVGNGANVGRISAVGAGGPQFGGFGGAVFIRAMNGAVTLTGGTSRGIAVDGGAGNEFGGDGGDIDISSDGQHGAAIIIDVPLSAKGVRDGAGGSVDIEGPGAVTISQAIDGRAVSPTNPQDIGGDGGDVDVVGLDQVTVASTAAIRVDGAGSGGDVTIEGGGDVVLRGAVSAASAPTLSGGFGGSLDIVSGGLTDIEALVDVSGSGPDSLGGSVGIWASGDVAITTSGVVNADGNGQSALGGEVDVLAGSPGEVGDVTVNGSVHARGSYMGTAGGRVVLEGCTVHVAGVVDTFGDRQAFNTVTARSALLVDGGSTRLRTTGGADPKSGNFVTVRTGTSVSGSGIVPPPIVVSKPTCVGPNQPANCLLACAVCGDGASDFPEECDAGAGNGPCQPCDATCHITNCDDGDPCTVDSCDAQLGCANEAVQGCYPPVSATAPAGGTVTTDPSGTGPTPAQPLQVAVTMPVNGTATIERAGSSASPQPGFTILGALARITLVPPDTLASNPFTLTFTLDSTIVPPGQTESTIDIQKNGVTLKECISGAFIADPDPCVFSRQIDAGGDVTISVLTSSASLWAALADACGDVPQAGCRTPADRKASVTMRNKGGSSSSFKWSWTRGAATSVQDFGDPLGTTDYTLCVYDHGGAGGSSRIRLRAIAPHGAVCGNRPCWKKTKSGFKYTNSSLTPDGLKELLLDAGESGRAKIVTSGKGSNLALPPLPLIGPVQVQLHRSGSPVCWDAAFGRSLMNDTDDYRAKSD